MTMLGHSFDHGRGDICRKCGKTHIDGMRGKKHKRETKEEIGNSVRATFKKIGYKPRGLLGKKQTKETKELHRKIQKEVWKRPGYREDVIKKLRDFHSIDNYPIKVKPHHFYGKRKVLEIMGTNCCKYCCCDDIRALEVHHTKLSQKPIDQHEHGLVLYGAIIKGKRKTDDLEVVCRVCNNLLFLIEKYGENINRWKIEWQK